MFCNLKYIGHYLVNVVKYDIFRVFKYSIENVDQCLAYVTKVVHILCVLN